MNENTIRSRQEAGRELRRLRGASLLRQIDVVEEVRAQDGTLWASDLSKTERGASRTSIDDEAVQVIAELYNADYDRVRLLTAMTYPSYCPACYAWGRSDVGDHCGQCGAAITSLPDEHEQEGEEAT